MMTDAQRKKNHERYIANRETILAAQREYYQRNRDRHAVRTKAYYERNKAKIIAYQIEYARTHPDEAREWRRNGYLRNKAKHYAVSNACRKRRRANNDPQFIMAERLRIRLWTWIKRRAPKAGHIKELIGCSIEQLCAHLQSRFQDGMTWDNRRLWHIDHIRPCASFDLNDPEQQRACFHYSNLQPLWRFDNQSKGCRT